MGILKAGAGALGGALAEQWLECFSCGAMGQGLLLTRGVKQIGENSANVKGEPNIISDGSVILVADGQCALAVEQGQVIGVYDTPGEHRFSSELTKGVFSKDGGRLKSLGKQMWERIGYGGDAHFAQYVMYLNLLEQTGIPFAADVPFHMTANALDLDGTARVQGVFSFCIVDPLLFYRRVCGTRTHTVTVADLQNQLTEELKSDLNATLSALCAAGARPSALPGMVDDVCESLKTRLSVSRMAERGFRMVAVAISSVVCVDQRLAQRVETAAALKNPALAGATLVGAAAEALPTAAGNAAGTAVGNAAGNAAVRMNPLLVTAHAPAQNPFLQNRSAVWRCACGQTCPSRFCPNCGAKRPESE